jgi:hypothetical protein
VLVLVSFVLVLAAAVTLVVGLLQSGLTLIYLSIACSVLAGVVLAVAVLRGRPEARPATSGRSFTPPQRTQVPASVGAPSSAETTSSWSSPPASATSTPAPPPPPPSPAPRQGPSDDAATKAAGSALLGRLRGRKAESGTDGEPTVIAAPPVDTETSAPEPQPTAQIPIASGPAEDEDGFPISGYDRLRATELLAQLPALDRNQLEAVRQRESAGKNRFTIMSRIDSLLAAKEEPAWDAGDDSWEADADVDAVTEEDAAAFDADMAMDTTDDDEVAELVSPSAASGFPIAGYEGLTVGQILPRLSELDPDALAQVRAREEQGRKRGTILDRVDRLSARAGSRPSSGSGALAMPAAAAPSAPARKSTARKAAAPVSKTTAPAVKKARAPRAAKAVAVPVAPVPEPTPAPVKATTRKAGARKAPAAAAPVVPAPTAPTSPARRSPARKAAAPVVPPAPAAAPMKEAVKKARATKAAKATKATKRP